MIFSLQLFLVMRDQYHIRISSSRSVRTATLAFADMVVALRAWDDGGDGNLTRCAGVATALARRISRRSEKKMLAMLRRRPSSKWCGEQRHGKTDRGVANRGGSVLQAALFWGLIAGVQAHGAVEVPRPRNQESFSGTIPFGITLSVIDAAAAEGKGVRGATGVAEPAKDSNADSGDAKIPSPQLASMAIYNEHRCGDSGRQVQLYPLDSCVRNPLNQQRPSYRFSLTPPTAGAGTRFVDCTASNDCRRAEHALATMANDALSGAVLHRDDGAVLAEEEMVRATLADGGGGGGGGGGEGGDEASSAFIWLVEYLPNSGCAIPPLVVYKLRQGTCTQFPVGDGDYWSGGCAGLSCQWFSQGCTIGCGACTGDHTHKSGSVCNRTMAPTLPDVPKYRTFNRARKDPRGDWTAAHPWRAPGHAPVYDACGVAGGSPRNNEAPGGHAPPGHMLGDKGSNLPPITTPGYVPPVWRAGSVVHVTWAIAANHGGGYQFRLCRRHKQAKAGTGEDYHLGTRKSVVANAEGTYDDDENSGGVHRGGTGVRILLESDKGVTSVTEACFQQTPLEFASRTHTLTLGNGSIIKAPATLVAVGTKPEGSTWAMNPIPACMHKISTKSSTYPESMGYVPDGGAHSSAVELATYLPTNERRGPGSGADGFCAEPQFEPPKGCDETCWGSTDNHTVGKVLPTITDALRVPNDLPAGQYILGWRWDCEETAQIWASCSDVVIETSAEPTLD